MHSRNNCPADPCDFPVKHRRRSEPTRQRLALSVEVSGRRKMADAARYGRRSQRKAAHDGAHRRRLRRL